MTLLQRISGWYFTKESLPHWCILAIDCCCVLFSGVVARYITVGGGELAGTFWPMIMGLLFTVLIYAISFRIFRTYSGIIRYSSFTDLQRVAISNGCAAVVCYGLSWLIWLIPDVEKHIIMQNFWAQGLIFVFATLLMWVERVLVKTMYDLSRSDERCPRAMIYGIRDGGVAIAKSIRSQSPLQYNLCGFIAPKEETNIPEMLSGVNVYPEGENVLTVIANKDIKAILVSPMQSHQFRKQADFIDAVIKAGVHIYMMPYEAEEWDGKSPVLHSQLKEVDIEDLLPRDKIEVDLNAIGELIKDKVVLITGAAGSIGYEMTRQIAKFNPKHLVLVDSAETPMHTVRLHMKNHYEGLPCETIVTTITNQTRMEQIFSAYRPDYVFHAAAYKHVPMMEDNPAEAVQNNIYGTRVIADLAVKYGTKKFVMISTDKAVNPTNVMGCSKRICEIYCQSLNNKLYAETQRTGEPTTQFITTRFGNVLGSNGSVIPLFKKQIANGGPVTVTHPDIVRFFMLIPEACRLVLQAGTMGKGGEIYVFDMGDPVRIADLAQRMINLSGAKNIEIKYTGLRDGEKLYEEVLSDAEQSVPTSHPKIRAAKVRSYDYDLAVRNEEELLALSYTYDDIKIVAKMKEIVPEYKTQNNERYEALDKSSSN